MGGGDRYTLLDRAVEAAARGMDALGWNGSRLRWKWRQQRSRLGESGLKTEIAWRAARGRHKMCKSCRALIARTETRCPECGEAVRDVAAPGLGRFVTNLIPGASAATSLLLLANGFWFVMLLMAQAKTGGGSGLFSHFGGELLYRFGSGFSPATVNGEWWRLITPIFLHGGILHFFFNSYVLLQLGPLVEAEFGTQRFWVIYLLCGISGSAASQFIRPVNTVGASGAILGLIGLLLVYGWRRGGVAGQTIKQAMVRYCVYIVVFSLLVRNIDHLNHAGGFLCGAALSMVVPAVRDRSEKDSTLWQVLAMAGVLLVVASFFMVATRAG